MAAVTAQIQTKNYFFVPVNSVGARLKPRTQESDNFFFQNQLCALEYNEEILNDHPLTRCLPSFHS